MARQIQTIIERALMSEVHSRLRIDYTFSKHVVTYLDLAQNGHYPSDFISSIVQQPTGVDSLDLYDGFVIGAISTLMAQGRIVWFDVNTSGTPKRDKNRRANQRILEEIDFPFSATFFGGQGDFDGILTMSCSRDGSSRIVYPLEVGFTKSATTLQHLLRRHGVARWPHESSAIQVLAFRPLKSDLSGSVVTK